MTRTKDHVGRFDAAPVHRFRGFRIVSRSDTEAILSMEARPEFVQEAGVVHGGMLTSLADTAAVCVLFPGLPSDRMMTSIEFKVNFLRPALPDRGPITAHARLVQRGRRVGVCEVEVSQADKPVVRGLFTYLFFRQEDRDA